MKRNRRFSRPQPRRFVVPQNVSLARKRSQTSRRFWGWLALAALGYSIYVAIVIAGFYMSFEHRFEIAVAACAIPSLLGSCALSQALLLKHEIRKLDQQLGLRQGALESFRASHG